MARGKTTRILVRILILVGLVALVFAGFAAFRVGPPPTIEIESRLPGIGKRTPIDVAVSEPTRGLAGFRVELIHGDRVDVLEEREYEPLEGWRFWGGDRVTREDLTVEVGSETVEGLREGSATVRVVAERAGAWLSRPEPVEQAIELQIKLRPPSIQVTSTRTYVSQGGCEAVIYRVGPSAVRDGVQAGEWWFPGYPLPGGDEQERFVLFGIPFDMADVSEVKLIAADDVGNRASAGFIDSFQPRPFRSDTIRLSDGFMERVVPPILEHAPELQDQGNLLDNYLMINGELRRRNAETLTELSRASKPSFLWSRHFLQMRNAQVMSNFADRRTYVYEGREVDRQDHLGFDLASTGRAPVQAANDGTVVMARYFGIYGNAVAIDHGYGLVSLYGHLSTISVEEGQEVQRGDEVGRSGQTGLAGGDHLHFTMLLQGLSVNPREWWDAHWIQDRLKLKFGDAMPFDG